MIRLAGHLHGRPSDVDIDKIVEWLNDKELMKYSEQRHLEHTRETQNDHIYTLGWLGSSSQYRLAYCNDVLVGTITANIDRNNSVADVGILIGSEHTGHGHGCAVWRMFCDELAQCGVRKIEAGCMAQNKAMIRIFEKNSMRLEGTRRYHFQTGKNQYDDMVLYGMLT